MDADDTESGNTLFMYNTSSGELFKPTTKLAFNPNTFLLPLQ